MSSLLKKLILIWWNKLKKDSLFGSRSTLCPAETACHQLSPPMSCGGLGVRGGGDWYPSSPEEDDAPHQHL